jgi:Flp pilus assembly protein TadD
MRYRSWLGIALVALLVTPALAQKKDAEAHVTYGIELARKGIWTEARHQFERATQIEATYGAAWNNLGISLEQLGQFDEARKAYEKALEIEPGNTFYRNNYDLFREIYDRQNRRRDR